MGFKVIDDKIGALTNIGGTIYLAPSILSLGGQQFRTPQPLTLMPANVIAGQQYMIYAVISSTGTISLVASLLVNSVGPGLGLPWKLVGAFLGVPLPGTLTGGLPNGVGPFVNIRGVPRSILAPVAYNQLYTTGAATSLITIKGTTTIDQFAVARDGDQARFKGQFAQTTGASAVTNGDNLIGTNGFALDLSKYAAYTVAPISSGNPNNTNIQGSASTADNTNTSSGYAVPYSSTQFRLQISYINNNGGTRGYWNSPSFFTLAGAIFVAYDFQYPIAGWTNTPLEDL